MGLPSVLTTLWRRYRQTFDTGPLGQPLLSAAELDALAAFAQARPAPLIQFGRETSHPLPGERPSRERGRGFEFEENRLYQAGDEPRLMNWRLYARSGELYSKVFSEERRPQACLLLDRRAAMRFATRGRLKAALAAALASAYAFDARRQALAVGGLVLGETLQWLAPQAGGSALQALLQLFTAPCPPLDFDRPQPGLGEALGLLDQHLPPGAFILLVSDFADLDDSVQAPLGRLAERHTVQAIQVLDPVEQALPATGDYRIEAAGGVVLPLRGGDVALQARYREAFAGCQQRLAERLARAGVPLSIGSTEQDAEDVLG